MRFLFSIIATGGAERRHGEASSIITLEAPMSFAHCRSVSCFAAGYKRISRAAVPRGCVMPVASAFNEFEHEILVLTQQ